MFRNSLRFTTCALAVALTVSGMGITAEAATTNSTLPSGGVGVLLSQGNKLENISTDVKKTDVQIEAIVEEVENEAEAAKALEQHIEEENFKNLVIAQVNDYVNVRSLPSEEGEVLGKLYDDSVGTFISEENGWYIP